MDHRLLQKLGQHLRGSRSFRMTGTGNGYDCSTYKTSVRRKPVHTAIEDGIGHTKRSSDQQVTLVVGAEHSRVIPCWCLPTVKPHSAQATFDM